MVGKVSAENVFGQVLICLRLSKLNYIVKETPYSAYVTIRKKFIKETESEGMENENVDIVSENIRNCESVIDLKKKIDNLSRNYGMLEFIKEELDVKYEAVEKEKIQLEDQIEEVHAEKRELLKSNEKLLNDNAELKDVIENKNNEINNITKAANKLKASEALMKDFEEQILMLENKIESRDLEITELKTNVLTVVPCEKCKDTVEKETDFETHLKSLNRTTKLSLDSLASTSLVKDSAECEKCEECDFVAKTKDGMKIHRNIEHKFKCEHCDVTFAGSAKFKKHVCRIHVRNPSFVDL